MHGEPSVPCLDGSYNDKAPISATPDDQRFVFRNSIYSPLGTSVDRGDQFPQRRSTNSSQDFNPDLSMRHDSTASEGRGRRKQNGTSIKNKTHQDIADHFMYQVPNSFTSDDGSPRAGGTVPSDSGSLLDPVLLGGETYQNSDSVNNNSTVLSETSFVENPNESDVFKEPKGVKEESQSNTDSIYEPMNETVEENLKSTS